VPHSIVRAHDSRSINGTERCERRRAAIRALQQAVERFADATAFIPSACAAQFRPKLAPTM